MSTLWMRNAALALIMGLLLYVFVTLFNHAPPDALRAPEVAEAVQAAPPAPRNPSPAVVKSQTVAPKLGTAWQVQAQSKRTVLVSYQQSPNTACHTALPLLCVYHTGKKRKDQRATLFQPKENDLTYPRHLLATEPVYGDEFETLAQANQYCAAALGDGWEVAGAEKTQQSHAFSARGVLPETGHYWAHVQASTPSRPAGNCWAE